MHTATECSCGKQAPHVMARRMTADGAHVLLWSDGSVTGSLGVGVYGRAPRKRRNVAASIEAGWLVAGEVELYDHREVRRLVVVARRAVAQRNMPPLTYLRRVMAGVRFHSDGRVVRAHAARCECAACLQARIAAHLSRAH